MLPYIILYPLAIAEGPVLMFIAGFSIRLGVLDFWPAYLILIFGDLTGDILWYFIGLHGARPLIHKYGRFLSIDIENFEKFERLFRGHETKIIFLSKITMGFGFALGTLMAAGAVRVPFKKYFSLNLIGGFVWTGILILAGYFFGHIYTMVDKSLKWMFVSVMIITIVLAVYGFGKYMRKKYV